VTTLEAIAACNINITITQSGIAEQNKLLKIKAKLSLINGDNDNQDILRSSQSNLAKAALNLPLATGLGHGYFHDPI